MTSQSSKSIFLIVLISMNMFCSWASEASANRAQMLSFLNSKTDYAIDDALNLLKDLLKAAQDELDALKAAWPAEKKTLDDSVDVLTQTKNSQTEKCNGLTNENTDLLDKISKIEKIIADEEKRLVDNADALKKLLDARCEENRKYIGGLKSNKILLELIQILRAAVNNFSPQLLQKGQLRIVAAKLINFLNFASKKHLISLNQIMEVNIPQKSDVRERTEEEIGSGHVDNTNSELSIDKFTSQTIEELQSIRTKLLNLLDVIETNLKTEIAQNEKNEADANEAVADFQIKIETENHWISKDLIKQQAELDRLNRELNQNTNDLKECNTKLQEDTKALENAQNLLNNRTNHYNDEVTRLEGEIELFEQVVELYETGVANTVEGLKKEVDEEIAKKSSPQLLESRKGRDNIRKSKY